MMQDGYRRTIDYLRVSVTDRCNLRCLYCIPKSGVPWFDREDLLSFLEIDRLIREVFVPLGVRKVRLTGGEPLLRPQLSDLVAMIRANPEVSDLALSTNGTGLAPQAGALRDAGLTRVNISLDATEPETFRSITRTGKVERVLEGIDAALAVGLDPVKLNCVVVRGVNHDQLGNLAAMTLDRRLHVRFIELMPVGDRQAFERHGGLSVADMIGILGRQFKLVPLVHGPPGNGPASYWQIEGAMGTLGFIHPMSRNFCDACNRLRLTANGQVKACLLNSKELDLRSALRNGASPLELRQMVLAALAQKPEWHEMGTSLSNLTMSQIGG